MNRSLIALTAGLLLAGAAYADSDQQERSRGEHRGPPEVALQACAAAVQGDACSFEGRGGEQLQGTCFAPEDKPLACKPEGGRPDRGSERQ